MDGLHILLAGLLALAVFIIFCFRSDKNHERAIALDFLEKYLEARSALDEIVPIAINLRTWQMLPDKSGKDDL